MLILLHPVDDGAVMNNHIDSVAKHLPRVVVKSEARLCQVTNDRTELGGPRILPYAVSAK